MKTTVLFLCAFWGFLGGVFPGNLGAEIYRWDTGETIPGTEGRWPDHPGMDWSGLDLSFGELGGNWEGASLVGSNLTEARLLGNLTWAGADFTDADITRATLRDLTRAGFKGEQLYQTANYKAKNLAGVNLNSNLMNGWNFEGQDLTGANLGGWAYGTGSSFVGATMRGAVLPHVVDIFEQTAADFTGAVITGSVMPGTMVYYPIVADIEGDVTIVGRPVFSGDPLTPWSTAHPAEIVIRGNGGYEVGQEIDILDWYTAPDHLFAAVGLPRGKWRTNQLHNHGVIEYLADVPMGDSNADGVFGSGDLVTVFQAGKYETASLAGWNQGDWDGDGVFGTADLVTAFQSGGYEQPTLAVGVPEPRGLWMILIGTCVLCWRRI